MLNTKMANLTFVAQNISNISLETFCELYKKRNENVSDSEPDWTLRQVAWTFMFSLILVVAILGNSIVIWIILAHRSMWSVTNYFLFNLTLADLMMATLNCIPSFIFMRDRVWRLGYIYCKMNTFLSYVTVPASVFTLLAITIDRRKAIVHPLKPKMPRIRVLVIIALIWVLSSVIALPPTIVTKHFQHGRCVKKYLCVPIWPETADGDSSKYDHVYNVIFSVVTYLTPMLGMGVCYVEIGKNLWGGEVIGEIMVHPAVLKSRKNKKKVVIMFAVVIAIFMVCWLPYQLYFIFLYYIPDLKHSKYIGDIYLSFYWLAMANSCVNPIIYYWMNARFREYFNSVLFCVPRYLHRVTTGSLKRTNTNNNASKRNVIRFKQMSAGGFEDIPVRALGPTGDQSKISTSNTNQIATDHINLIGSEIIPATEILF